MAPRFSKIRGDNMLPRALWRSRPGFPRQTAKRQISAVSTNPRGDMPGARLRTFRQICGDNMLPRALWRSRLGFPRETAGERLERDSQAKRQSRSPRSKVERVEIPGDGTGERRHIVPATLYFKRNSLVLLCFWQFFHFSFFGI